MKKVLLIAVLFCLFTSVTTSAQQRSTIKQAKQPEVMQVNKESSTKEKSARYDSSAEASKRYNDARRKVQAIQHKLEDARNKLETLPQKQQQERLKLNEQIAQAQGDAKALEKLEKKLTKFEEKAAKETLKANQNYDKLLIEMEKAEAILEDARMAYEQSK